MRNLRLAASTALLAAALALSAPPSGACAGEVTFLSTQLRPIEAAQQVREVILKAFQGSVAFVTEQPAQLTVRVKAEQQGGSHSIDVVGALHGELQPLVPLDALMPLDDVAAKLADRGIPAGLMTLGKLGTSHQLYIPWMQATYIMVANKQALPYLPEGAKLDALTYDQLGAWAKAIQDKTGKRMLGFPAGPTGLMHRFLEGFLYPSFTGGVVTSFKSPEAEAMWTQFATMWKSVTPNSTNYNFMQEPLLAGDVWIAFDHIARVIDALQAKPDDFVAFPAPSGPKGRGYAPVIAGLGVLKNSANVSGADALIEYLSKPETQILTARSVGFFPVVTAQLPNDLDPGIKLGADAIARTQGAKDALLTMLPVGLGQRGGEFDKIYLDTFQLIVLRGQSPHAVLEKQADALNRILADTGAPCWLPDPESNGACKVR